MKQDYREIALRWSDIDANFHLRHSVYYDFGAQIRTELLNDIGLSLAYFQKAHIGPILFREEAVFKREIRYGDRVLMNIEIIRAKKDFSRWSIRHTFIRSEDQAICTILTVDGAWMDTIERKLCVPTENIQKAFEHISKALDFELLD